MEKNLEWIKSCLWDTEIIPCNKGIKKLHLFTTPIGQRFQYSDKIKDYCKSNTILAGTLPSPNEFKVIYFAIRLPDNILSIDKETICNGVLSLIRGGNTCVKQIPIKETLLYLGNKLIEPDKIINKEDIIIYHLRSTEAYRIEINWEKEVFLIRDIEFNVFLLGLLGRLN